MRQRGDIVYLVLIAIAIVTVVSIVIPGIISVTSSWNFDRAWKELQDGGYSVYADPAGNMTVTNDLTVGGDANIAGTTTSGFFVGDGTGLTGLPVTGTPTLQQVTDTGNVTTNIVEVGGLVVPNVGIGTSSSTNYPLLIANGGTQTFIFWPDGHLSTLDGLSTESVKYGPGLVVYDWHDFPPISTSGTGSFDLIGNILGDSIFTRSSGPLFTLNDAEVGNWLVLWGTDFGAYAEIKRYIDGSNVELHTMGWDRDFTSQSYLVFSHPIATTGYGFNTEFSTGSNGIFEIYSYDYSGSEVLEVVLNSGSPNTTAVQVDAKANGNTGTVGIRTSLNTGNLFGHKSSTGQSVVIDDSEAVTAGTETYISAYAAVTLNASNATQEAYIALPDFDTAFRVFGASGTLPSYGYEVTSGVVIDRVNSGGAGNDAFINQAVNVQIFDNDNDYILIGSDSKFELCTSALLVDSNKNIEANFYYSKAGGNWTVLELDTDTTSGYLDSGSQIFDAPADWTKDDEAVVNGDIADAFYIKIQRTRDSVPVPPTELVFSITSSQAAGMRIWGDGSIKPASLADSSARNGSIYYSLNASKLVYKDSGGVVRDLY